MTRSLRLATATVIFLAGVAAAMACAFYLAAQGLDRAEKWVSLVGVLASLGVSVTGLMMGLRAKAAGAIVRRTGSATALGRGSHANTGSIGGGDHHISDTGAAEARDGGQADTGIDTRPHGR
jgi:hypothetical protein